MDPKDKIGYSIGFVFLIGMGVWALMAPTAMEAYASSEIASGWKQFFADFWGAKLGIGLIALGGLALFGLHQSE